MMAPIIIIILPKKIAPLRPSPSLKIGTKGRDKIAPREYIADIRPRRVERGEWKTRKRLKAKYQATKFLLTGIP